jgi:hypothetical protein
VSDVAFGNKCLGVFNVNVGREYSYKLVVWNERFMKLVTIRV